MTDQAKLLAEAMLTDEQLRAVGCLTLEANHLEIYIDSFVIHLCGENVGNLLLQRKMLDAKIELVKALIFPELNNRIIQERFAHLYERIKSDIPRRNAAIHGDWGLGRLIPLSDLLSYKHNDGAKAIYRKLTVKASEIMDIARRFAEYQMEFIDFALLVRATQNDEPSSDMK